MMTSVFLDYNTIGPEELDSAPLKKCLPGLKLFDSTSPEEVPNRVKNAEFILTNKVKLFEGNLKTAEKLKFIGLTATGADNIDLDYAKSRDIRVCNIQAYCTQSVVEHVFGSILNLTHNIYEYQNLVQNGAWQKSDDFCMLQYPIRELSSMTIGIIGYGELGRNVAKMARTFNMRVLVNTRSKNKRNKYEKHVSLQNLLKNSDVVSLHCPLTDETKHLISNQELGLMKPNSILINTARGALIESKALFDALIKNKISGAAIDVLPEEPPTEGNVLLDYKGRNLFLTPHIAWGTIEARQNAINQLANAILAFKNNESFNVLV